MSLTYAAYDLQHSCGLFCWHCLEAVLFYKALPALSSVRSCKCPLLVSPRPAMWLVRNVAALMYQGPSPC